jgi:serine/threonine protein kinase
LGNTLGGRYHLDAVIGLGGMGTVYQATDVTSQRQVAVKTLHAFLSGNHVLAERFRREATVASRLDHPNIIRVHEFGRAEDGTCFIAMELLEGDNVRELVQQQGPFTLRRAVHLLEEAAAAAAFAHAAGVVHRDIKPHNLVLNEVDGVEQVKVLDFGLVKALDKEDAEELTATGMVMGTPQYMSPEQTLGEPVDSRSDLYSLAGVLYYCLAGTSPFGASNVQTARRAAFTQALTPVGMLRVGAPVPEAFDAFFDKGLAERREDRFQTAEELVAAVHEVIAGLSDEELDAQPSASRAMEEPVPASTVVTGEQARPAAGVSQRTKVLAAVAAFFLLAGMGIFMWLRPAGGPSLLVPEPVTPAVLVRMSSVPAGATVEEAGRPLGTTPLKLRFTKATTHALTFRLEGYSPESRLLDFSKLNQTETRLDVQLERAAVLSVPHPP